MSRHLPGRPVVAWCLFDFANSSYTTLIITVAFSVFFREAVVNAGNRGDWLWGMANFIAMAVVALSSPVLGAIADFSGRKKRFLVLLTLQTVVATALLSTVDPGNVLPAMALYVLGTIGFEAGYVFYNAFLPDVSTPRTMGRVSGWGWAVGYAGGLLSLVLCRPLISGSLHTPAGTLDPGVVRGYQLAFLLVACFFLVFAMPAFLWLRESAPQGDRPRRFTAYPRIGLARVRQTLSDLRSFPDTARFILASLLFTDGITTVISFSAIYATVTFGFTGGELVMLFLVLNVVAFPSAAWAGHLADAVGAKRTLMLSLLVWIGVVVVGAAAQNRMMFWMMAVGAAIGMGSTQAVGRSFMAQLTPPERESEFFGFYVLSGKFASMFGPLVFGFISRVTGSQRLAVLSLLPFFVAGLVVMRGIDERRARMRRPDPTPSPS